MPRFMSRYVAVVDAINYRIGRVAMYGIFVLIGILLWSSFSKVFFQPSLWTLEMAQFTLVAYYLLGAPYSMQLGANVRMDLLYARLPLRRGQPRRQRRHSSLGLERISGRNQPPDLVQRQCIDHETADPAVPAMRGVETAAEQPGEGSAPVQGRTWPVPRTCHL